MTEYQSEVMFFLFWIIRICQISICTLSRHLMDRQIVFSRIKSKSYIHVDECIEVTFSMFVVYDLSKSKSTNKSRSGKVMSSYRQYAIVELGHVYVFYLLFSICLCCSFALVSSRPLLMLTCLITHACISFRVYAINMYCFDEMNC